MDNKILMELAAKWERDAIPPNTADGSKEAEIGNAKEAGYRACKKECANTLRLLDEIFSN